MIIEICLVVMAVTHGVLISALCIGVWKVKDSTKHLRADVQKIASETTKLLDHLNELVRSDLPRISEEAIHLMSQTAELTSSLNEKAKSNHFLFTPLGVLSAGIGFLFSRNRSSEEPSKFPAEALKWVSRGLFLMKVTKELVRKHGK